MLLRNILIKKLVQYKSIQYKLNGLKLANGKDKNIIVNGKVSSSNGVSSEVLKGSFSFLFNIFSSDIEGNLKKLGEWETNEKFSILIQSSLDNLVGWTQASNMG